MKQTPLRAIKKHCLECSGYEKKQVRECVIKDCVLFAYRQGKNPNRKGSTVKKAISIQQSVFSLEPLNERSKT
ncbi:MAG: hypothetical protein WCZ90_18430 [Melioribacteraceae bacterium]